MVPGIRVHASGQGDRHGAGTVAESLHLFFTGMRWTERAKLGMVCALETSAHDQ